jgi:GTP cyclohydrolase-4
MDLPDVHERMPEIGIPLQKVGVMGVKMPIGFISFEGKRVMVIPSFDLFIDLPANMKGIHSSRNYEAITDVLGKYVGKTYKLENLCASVSKELLERHPYATRSEVKARGEAVFERKTPETGILTYESCNIMARAVAEKFSTGDVKVRKTIGVEVVGMTACPCAQESLREMVKMEMVRRCDLPEGRVSEILDRLPIATHIQRGYGSILIEIDEDVEVDAMRLVPVIEDSMSAGTYELLKRQDEIQLVEKAALHPRFVEDCVRYMIVNTVKSFPELPDETSLTFKQRNEESIHKHDIFAERITTMGQIREEWTNYSNTSSIE